MVLSKRERIVAIATIAVLGLFGLDRWVLTPVLQRRDERMQEIEAALAELERASLLFTRKRQLTPAWRQMLENGLDAGPAEADSRTLHAIRDWSQRSGLALASVRPERSIPRGELHEIVFHATGTGRMRAVRGFLERLETSSLPLRVAELQIGSRREGTDDLSLQLRISALCRKAERKPDPEAPPQEPERPELPAPPPEPQPGEAEEPPPEAPDTPQPAPEESGGDEAAEQKEPAPEDAPDAPAVEPEEPEGAEADGIAAPTPGEDEYDDEEF